MKGPIHALPHSVPRTTQWATTNPRLQQRFLDTHRQVRVRLLWGHCSFLQGPVHKVPLCPPRAVSPVLSRFWQCYGAVNGDLLQEGLCHTQVCCTKSPCPCCRPLPTHTSTQDTQILKSRSGSVSVGFPGEHKVLFESFECLWQVWGLILNAISPL